MKKENHETSNINADDDKMLDIEDPIESISDNVKVDKINFDANQIVKTEVVEHVDIVATKSSQDNVQKPLRELFVNLNSIQPHETFQSQCILDEPNGLKIVLNFAKDRPRTDVAVLVLTTTNFYNQPISNYQFEASVSKVKRFN